MVDTQDFRKGTWIELDGEPWMVLEVHKHAPTARGGKTLVQTKLRNLLDQRITNRSFKAGEMFKEPDLRRQKVSYLYKTADSCAFMDKESYDQFEFPTEKLGGNELYFTEDIELEAVYYNDKLVGIDPPQYVELEVTSVMPGTRGDTSGKVTTPATLSTGLTVDVPLFIKAGDRIRVNTRTGEFQDRVR